MIGTSAAIDVPAVLERGGEAQGNARSRFECLLGVRKSKPPAHAYTHTHAGEGRDSMPRKKSNRLLRVRRLSVN